MVYAENKVKNIFGFYKNRFIFAEVKNKETMGTVNDITIGTKLYYIKGFKKGCSCKIT